MALAGRPSNVGLVQNGWHTKSATTQPQFSPFDNPFLDLNQGRPAEVMEMSSRQTFPEARAGRPEDQNTDHTTFDLLILPTPLVSKRPGIS